MHDMSTPICIVRVSTVFLDSELEHISVRLQGIIFFGCLPSWGERRVDEANAAHESCVCAANYANQFAKQ